jgi:hypothetical protein
MSFTCGDLKIKGLPFVQDLYGTVFVAGVPNVLLPIFIRIIQDNIINSYHSDS